MKLKIPYALLPIRILEALSRPLLGIGQDLENIFPFLKLGLRQSGMKIAVKEYISMCLVSTIIFFFSTLLVLFFTLGTFELENYILISLTAAVIFSIFVFIQQMIFPRVVVLKRVGGIERNLLAALQSLLVQLNSGG